MVAALVGRRSFGFGFSRGSGSALQQLGPLSLPISRFRSAARCSASCAPISTSNRAQLKRARDVREYDVTVSFAGRPNSRGNANGHTWGLALRDLASSADGIQGAGVSVLATGGRIPLRGTGEESAIIRPAGRIREAQQEKACDCPHLILMDDEVTRERRCDT